MTRGFVRSSGTVSVAPYRRLLSGIPHPDAQHAAPPRKMCGMGETVLLTADVAAVDGRLLESPHLLIEEHRIRAITTSPAARTAHRVRIEGTLLPGAIDLQVNGAGGHAVDEADPAALAAVAAQVWRGGAVAFAPTLISAPWERLCAQVEAVARWIAAHPGGTTQATPLGLHLEGPFLSVPGAHPPDALCDPTKARIEELLAAAQGQLALVTLAPDRSGAADAVTALRAAGVAVALGHGTARDPDAVDACVAAGAGLVTHLFNASDPLHHRAPGLAGLALTDDRLRASLIADGVHVHPGMLRVAWRCLGTARTVLVTDSVGAAGMPDGSYTLGGAPVEHRDGVVRDARGALAGAALTMSEAARRFAAAVGADPVQLAAAISTNPAAVLGLDDRGRIAVGQRADFSVLRPDGTLQSVRF